MHVLLVPVILQAVPRKVWLDSSGKQLLQWPIEEIQQLRENSAAAFDKDVKSGNHFEITGLRQTSMVGTHIYMYTRIDIVSLAITSLLICVVHIHAYIYIVSLAITSLLIWYIHIHAYMYI